MSITRTEENVEKYGWEALHVFDPEGVSGDFTYTIGLEKTYGHPEIMIFGLGKETMHRILSDLVDDIANGFVAEENEEVKGVLSGDYGVIFKSVRNDCFDNYLGHAKRYYRRPFRAYVMFWPDRNWVFPFQEGCEVTVQDEAKAIVL